MPDLSKPTLAWTLPWDADWVTAVAWVGRSRRLAAGNNLGGVVLWDLPAQPGGEAPKPTRRLDGHTNAISKLASTPDGSVLLSASYDHTVRLWNPAAEPSGTESIVLNARAIADAEARKRNGARVPPAIPASVGVVKDSRVFAQHREWVTNLALTRDGRTAISGDDGGHVLVWDTLTATVRTRWQVRGWAYGLAIGPDGRQACVGERVPLVFDSGRHAGLKLWDAATGTVVRDLSADFKGQHIAAAAYSPDGSVLAIGRGGEADGNGPNVTLVDPTGAKKPRPLTPGHLNGATDVAFHPDGKHLASCGRDTVVRIWDMETGRLVSEAGKPRGGQFKDWFHAAGWSADGAWLAAADMAGAVQVWHFPG
jgi:WD40 repeat protein